MFNFGNKSFLGIDIGTSTIKMVEIKLVGDKPQLVNYAWMPLFDIVSREDANSSFFEVTIPGYIKRMINEAGFKSKDAYISVPASGGLITLIDFPEMNQADMEQAIRFEAHKYIPTSLDEVALSWDIVSPISHTREKENDTKSSKPEKRVQVLLVAAPKNKVLRYEKMIKNSRLNLKLVEIESFAMVDALVGHDPGSFVIVDIGARVCNMLLVEDGIIKANRNIDAGGKNITNIIARSMGIDDARAESLKMSGKNFLKGEMSLNFPVLELIAGEVSRMINAYYNGESGRVSQIILSGGTAQFKGIEEYFMENLKIKTVIGNPLGRVVYDPKIQSALLNTKSRFSVAIGLALKGAIK